MHSGPVLREAQKSPHAAALTIDWYPYYATDHFPKFNQFFTGPKSQILCRSTGNFFSYFANRHTDKHGSTPPRQPVVEVITRIRIHWSAANRRHCCLPINVHCIIVRRLSNSPCHNWKFMASPCPRPQACRVANKILQLWRPTSPPRWSANV